MEKLLELLGPVGRLPWAPTIVYSSALVLAATAANWLARVILRRVLERVVKASTAKWDDALLSRGVLTRLVNVVPALVVAGGVALVPGLSDDVVLVINNVAFAFIALTVALSIGNLLNAVNDIYDANYVNARARPIKGYLQMVKLVVFIVAGVMMLAALLDKSPLILLSGFGAMSAVLMLVFKDTILSLVASMQLASNDMLRVGDWIEMPSLGADGDVVDMALNTVKVQNWDKTITTIPTYRLISESFKNWRGMQESGGRRIKRALLIDQSSVRFLSDAERNALRRIALIDDYLERKKKELEEYNATLIAGGKDPVNTRRVTNIGTFRAYVTQYLRAHPGINQNMTQMVRQLAPGPTGLPLELYCFTATVSWVPYEGTQADIFDHLIAMLPEFGLRLYQNPGGADIAQAAVSIKEVASGVREDDAKVA